MVGVIQALTGDTHAITESIQQKADSWLHTIKSNFLPRPLLWTTLFHMLWPSLWYLLSVMALSPAQAHQTTSRLYQTLLPHLGVNRHFPLALRYANPQYLGLGLPNPYWEQGIRAIHLFMEHANSDTMEAGLIQTSMEYLHLELGTSRNIFKLSYAEWAFLAMDCWLKSIWCFTDLANLGLISHWLLMPPPPRQGNGAFMDQIMGLRLPHKTIEAINQCCIAHHVFFWSDLVNRWGNQISPSMLRPPVPAPNSKWKWPLECHSLADMATWSSFLRDSLYTSSGRLLSPLRAWLNNTHHTDFIPLDHLHQSAYLLGHGPYWRTFRPDSQWPYCTTRLFWFSQVALSLPAEHHLA